MNLLDKVKANKRQEIKLQYENVLNNGCTFNVNGKNIVLKKGIETLSGLSIALQSAKIQMKTTVRFSDAISVHEMHIVDFENLIGQATVWGDQQWNKKADLYQYLDSIKIENYPNEDAAVAAVQSLQWRA